VRAVTDEALRPLAICREKAFIVTPRGGGDVRNAARPVNDGIVTIFQAPEPRRLAHVEIVAVWFDRRIVLDDLNRQLRTWPVVSGADVFHRIRAHHRRPMAQQFPAAGSRLRYGTMRDNTRR